jgi:hypothetical protein
MEFGAETNLGVCRWGWPVRDTYISFDPNKHCGSATGSLYRLKNIGLFGETKHNLIEFSCRRWGDAAPTRCWRGARGRTRSRANSVAWA